VLARWVAADAIDIIVVVVVVEVLYATNLFAQRIDIVKAELPVTLVVVGSAE